MGFEQFRERMQRERIAPLAIETFARQYAQLVAGESGLMPEAAIAPVRNVPQLEELSGELATVGAAALERCVMIKLNGGLGTSMGLERAKSLLEVKGSLSFLDVIAQHAISANVRLVLMNSFSTQQDSLEALGRYAELGQGPHDFLQHKVPKIDAETLAPIDWPSNPALEWNPPGHGDLYTALQTSGMLDSLLAEGRDLAFVSNADNLGASIDPRLVGYMAKEKLPFLMEVAERTEADRKGGHLARSASDGLVLREAAQCPAEDEAAFQDITRHRYFNTNNIWLDLRALRDQLVSREGLLPLALIRNEKRVDPRDADSPRVFQLETAMGSAISLLAGAGAICVPRARFAPVKTTDDLLVVRSDATVLTDDFRVVLAPGRAGAQPLVVLDRRYYAHADQLDERFPAGPPSLLECSRLEVEGDVRFGAAVRVLGDVRVRNEGAGQLVIDDGSVLEG